MRKLLVLLLVLSLAFTLFLTACKKDDDAMDTPAEEKKEDDKKEDEKEEISVMTPKGELPIVNVPTTLTVMLYGNIDTDYSKNYFFSQEMIPRTGVDLDFIVTDTDQFKTKLNLLFTAGDAPDVVSGAGNGTTMMNPGQVLGYYAQDLIFDLAPLVDEWSVNIIKHFEDTDNFPGLKEVAYTPDGKLLGIPNLNTCYHCSIYQKFWINNAWLENLDLDIPTTPEEFKQTMIAFRDQDANGNGDPSDEIPIVGCVSSSFTAIDGFLMMPFQYNDSNFERLAVDEDGKVYASYTQNGYREGLKYLNDLWNEELIHPDTFTMNRDEMRAYNRVETFEQPRMYGTVAGAHHGYPAPTGGDLEGISERQKDYTAMKPLIGDDGSQYTVDHTFKQNYTIGQMLISTDSEIPEIAFRWIDAQWDGFYHDRSSGTYALGDIANQGIPGEDGSWMYADEGDKGYDGQQAWYKTVNPDGYPGYEDNPEDHPYFENISIRIYAGTNYHSGWTIPEGLTYKDDHPQDIEQMLYEFTDKNYAPYTYPLELTLPLVWLSAESGLEVSNYEVQLKTTVDEYVAKFVTGILDIHSDGDWNMFLEELDGIGLEQYLQMYQDAIDK